MVHVSNTTTASSEFNIVYTEFNMAYTVDASSFPLAPGYSALEKHKKAPVHCTEGQPICIEHAKETDHSQRIETYY